MKHSSVEVQLPKTFGYDSLGNKWGPCLAGGGLLVWIGFWIVTVLTKMSSTLRWVGWLRGGVALLLVGGLVIFVAMMYCAAMQIHREGRRRRDQHIAVNTEGIAFTDSNHTITATWEEVTDYYSAPVRLFITFPGLGVIETERGAISFTTALSDYRVLEGIVERYAKDAKHVRWRSLYDEVLGGDASRWSSDSAGVRRRVYHYRTRTNRALLWLVTITSVLSSMPSLLAHHGLAQRQGLWLMNAMAAATLGATIWLWWRYLNAEVCTDDAGIIQHSPFAERRIAWQAVERYSQNGGDGVGTCKVVGSRTLIRFWESIAELEELRAEIQLRAVNSQNKSWERDP